MSLPCYPSQVRLRTADLTGIPIVKDEFFYERLEAEASRVVALARATEVGLDFLDPGHWTQRHLQNVASEL